MNINTADVAGSHHAGKAFQPRLQPSSGLAEWLEATGGSLAFSTYETGRVFLVSARGGQLAAQHRRVGPAMGLAASKDRIWISSRDQLWRFVNTGPRLIDGSQHDAVYAPRWGILTGPCDTHEMAGPVTHGRQRHEIAFVNTRFSCIATIDGHYNFTPVWKPPFISGLAPEDRCHLNGLAVRDGALAYATACSQTDTAVGWRAVMANGGVLIDIAENTVVADGLSMPHSPRWHDGRVWLCNSGTAEFGWIDPDKGQFQPVASCPGFARGMAIVGGRWAVIGLSRQRAGSTGASLPMADRLAARGIVARCGLMVVDLQTGRTEHELLMDGSIAELFDVAFIEGVSAPYSTGFSEPELQRDMFNLPALDAFPISRMPTGPAAPNQNIQDTRS